MKLAGGVTRNVYFRTKYELRARRIIDRSFCVRNLFYFALEQCRPPKRPLNVSKVNGRKTANYNLYDDVILFLDRRRMKN